MYALFEKFIRRILVMHWYLKTSIHEGLKDKKFGYLHVCDIIKKGISIIRVHSFNCSKQTKTRASTLPIVFNAFRCSTFWHVLYDWNRKGRDKFEVLIAKKNCSTYLSNTVEALEVRNEMVLRWYDSFDRKTRLQAVVTANHRPVLCLEGWLSLASIEDTRWCNSKITRLFALFVEAPGTCPNFMASFEACLWWIYCLTIENKGKRTAWRSNKGEWSKRRKGYN